MYFSSVATVGKYLCRAIWYVSCDIEAIGQSNYVEIEGYEAVHARTHFSFSVADVVGWLKGLKVLLFQE